MLEFKYDTQLLIEGTDLDEDVITEYFTKNFKGDCLLAVGDEELIKIHYHTNEIHLYQFLIICLKYFLKYVLCTVFGIIMI